MDFTGESRSCALVCLLGRWSGLVLMSFQGLPCNPEIVCFINASIVFQSGSVFVKIPISLGSLFIWEAADLKIWEVLAGKETTWHCCWVCVHAHYCWMGSSQRSPHSDLLPFAFWQMSWITANYFSAAGKPLIYKYSFKRIQYVAVGNTLIFWLCLIWKNSDVFSLEF